MAIEKVINVKVKDKQAIKAFDDLGDAIVDTKNDIINLERELLKLERQLKKTNRLDFKGRKDLNKVITKTKQSIQEEKLALKSLTVQRGAAQAAARKQLKANRNLNKSYFDSKESLTDVNRLTAEFALKVKAVKNIFLGATQAVIKFAKAQKLAFAASVIGVAIIALITVLAFWEDINEAIQGTNKRLQAKIDLLNTIQKLNKSEIDVLDKQIALNKLQGKATEELQKQKLALINQQIILNQQELLSLNIQLEKLKSLGDELTISEKISALFKQRLFGQAGFAQSRKKSLDERKTAIAELSGLINSVTGDIIDLDTLLFKIANPDADKAKKQKRDRRIEVLDSTGLGTTIDDLISPEVTAELEKNIELSKAREQNKQDAALAQRLLTEQEREQAEARKKIAELEFQNKQDLLFAVADSVAAVGELLGRETAAGKALSVAASLINTYTAITGQLKAFAAVPIPGFAIAQAIATGLAGFAAVKNILKVKVPGEGGGGGSVPSGGSQQAAPSFNVVGTSGTNQLAQSLAAQDQPIQAFVVGSNVTSQQALDRNIISTATIG